MTVTFTGVAELDRALQQMQGKALESTARSAVRKAMSELAKSQRKYMPAKYKHLKKLIGSRYAKAKRGVTRGVYQAKAGFGVGKKQRVRDRKSEKLSESGKKQWKLTKAGQVRDTRTDQSPGVGISLNNIHWLVLGTARRTTKSGANRGSMPKILFTVVPKGTAAGMSRADAALVRIIAEWVAKGAK